VVSALESIRAKEQGFCFAIDHDDQTNQITKIAFMSSKLKMFWGNYAFGYHIWVRNTKKEKKK